MQEQKVEQEIDITKLSNEFTYRKYMMSRDSVRHLFSKLSVAEYVALQSIEAISGESAIYGGKAYLTDLSVRMQMSIRKTSKAVGISEIAAMSNGHMMEMVRTHLCNDHGCRCETAS